MRVAFSLIELIIVVIILSISSYLVLTSIHSTTPVAISADKLREFKNKIIYITTDGNKSIKITNPVVYDKNLKKIEFNKGIVFKYEVHNGIQNSYILKCDEGIYVFKPLETIKVNSLNKAKEVMNLDKYRPIEGNYYK